MKKYRTRFCHVGDLTGLPFFAVECDEGKGWRELSDYRLTADKAQELIQNIIEGEREYIVVPLEVSVTRYK